MTGIEKKQPGGMAVAAYAGAFAIVLPLALYTWHATAANTLAVWVPPPGVGAGLVGLGGALFVWATVCFIAQTRTLPVMIRSPSTAIVTGPYRLFSDPIYVGFCLLVFGVATLLGDAFAFWIIAPAMSVATYCYTLGIEALLRPRRADDNLALLATPPANASLSPRRAANALSAHMLVLSAVVVVLSATGTSALWAALSLLLALIGFYATLRDGEQLAGSALRHGITSAYVGLGILLVVTYVPGDAGNEWLSLSVAAIGAGIATQLRAKLLPGLLAAALLAIHALLASLRLDHAIALAALGIIVWLLPLLYRGAVEFAGAIANSWSSFRLGPVRVINYSAYAFASAAVGCLVFASVTGDAAVGGILIIAVATLAGAGIWGQALEATGKLSRPFGYFGAMIGAILGTAMAAVLLRTNIVTLGAALVLAAPWIQAIGRLRCLVQGCCHGRPTNPAEHGICYRNHTARAVAIGGFFNTPIYPTQLYSLLSNLLLGALLVRIALSGAPASTIIAVYWIGAGCSRFAEEAYRGEPQTKVVLGLKIYQWFSIVLIAAGIAVTYVRGAAIECFSLPGGVAVAVSIVIGLLYAFAMGVDFPESRSRLSQLTPKY